jgi:hypothetical protein
MADTVDTLVTDTEDMVLESDMVPVSVSELESSLSEAQLSLLSALAVVSSEAVAVAAVVDC